MPDRRADRPAAPRENTETVPASELKVGDKIHFPNSRHSQEIISISEEQGDVVRISSETSAWLVGSGYEVRRAVPDA